MEFLTTQESEHAINSYKKLLKNEIKKLPNGLAQNKSDSIAVVRYLISDILNWDREDICKYYCLNTLKTYKLNGLYAYYKSIYVLLNNSFPELNIKQWELINSSVSPDFWSDRNNVNEMLSWIKNKVSTHLFIDTLEKASNFGLRKISDTYNLNGFCACVYKSSPVKMFEDIFKEFYGKNSYSLDRYTFDVSLESSMETPLAGRVYRINQPYYNLDPIGKTLINEIIRYCEENSSFPKEKQMSKKNGYIPRTQFYKYFKSNSFTDIYNYISPIEEQIPSHVNCYTCGLQFEFTSDNFSKSLAGKFGLKYECRKCENKKIVLRRFKKIGIEFKNYEDIEPEIWYDYLAEKRISILPDFCSSKENSIRMLRHCVFNHLHLNCKNDLCDSEKFNIKVIKSTGLYPHYYSNFDNKLEFYRVCFPEFDIREIDVERCGYSEDTMIELFEEFIEDRNIPIDELIYQPKLRTIANNKFISMISQKFNGNQTDAILWFLNKRNITKFTIHDVPRKPNSYWTNEDNVKFQIRSYCEKNGILKVINRTDELKIWIYEHFTQEKIANVFHYSNYYDLYELITTCYPEIKSNNILFDWEWHQFNKYDREASLRMIRQLIKHRLNDLIIDEYLDIPKYLNPTFMSCYYSKFNKFIAKKRFQDYHHWCSEAYPEHQWSPEDFGIIAAKDGAKCSSMSEKIVYEFIKYDLGIKSIVATGNLRKGKYIFDANESSKENHYCPDFVIDVDYERKTKLDKPIIIEYFGMYSETNSHHIYSNYREKTKRKCNLYESLNNIIFVGIYPEDMSNGCKNVREKILESINLSRKIDILAEAT